MATLFELGEDLLGRAIQALADHGAPIPVRRMVYIVPVPVDCEQLVVQFTGWELFPPLGGPTVCSEGRWFGSFTVGISRPSPAVPKKATVAPSVDMMENAAKIASRDAEVLLSLVNGLDEIWEPDIRVGAPNGGFQMVELDVKVPG